MNRFQNLFKKFALSTLVVLTLSSLGMQTAMAADQESHRQVVPKQFEFFDNFNNKQKTGWYKVDDTKNGGESKWVINNKGVFTQTANTGVELASNKAAKPGTIALAGNKQWQDYEYKVQLGSADNDAIGAVFRYQDNNNYYRYSMDASKNYRRLVKKSNGKFTVLAESSGGYQPNKMYNLKVRAIGQNLQVYLDGQKLFDVNDASNPKGKIGLYSWGSQNSYFDNVNVKASVDSFSIVVIPDTQFYSRWYPQIFAKQTEWIAANRAGQNIAYVLHEGDVVDEYGELVQWYGARKSMDSLEGKLHYAIVPGNHDYPSTNFNKFFPLSKARQQSTFGGSMQSDSSDNTYHLFSAGGVDWLVMALEFDARDRTLKWAKSVSDQYPDRHGIMLTHDYLGMTTWNMADPQNYANPGGKVNNGANIWNKYVKKSANIQFTFNGHVIDENDNGAQNRKTSVNDAGNKVYQMLANYQDYSPGAAGGGGYLRILKFYPSESRVEVKTYSPYLNKYLTDSKNQFEYTNVDLQ